MDAISNEFIALLSFLLPGFIAAWVFHGLIPFPKPGQLERLVQALIFTMFVQAAVTVTETLLLLFGGLIEVGLWTEDVRRTWSVILGLLLGLLLARWATHDTIHRILRKWGFTSLTSYPSEWFSEFSRSQTYVVLHLTGERHGWPEQWPGTPNEGQFSIAQGEWLTDDARIPLDGVKNILVPVEHVEMVEFMHPLSETSAAEVSGGHENS